MSNIGEMKKGKEIGKNPRLTYTWIPCERCGLFRWVRYYHGVPISRLCRRCTQIGKIHSDEHKRKIGLTSTGRVLSTEAREKISKSKYKGDDAGVTEKHAWLRKLFGKANHCEYCHQNKSRFLWASLTHDYTRDVEDYIQLCDLCHRNYDLGKIAVLGQTILERKGKFMLTPHSKAERIND